MSSDMKDARWALADNWAEAWGLEFEDFTYAGWQKILDEAQRKLDKNPGDVEYWATRFRKDPQ